MKLVYSVSCLFSYSSLEITDDSVSQKTDSLTNQDVPQDIEVLQ